LRQETSTPWERLLPYKKRLLTIKWERLLPYKNLRHIKRDFYCAQRDFYLRKKAF
jgi:hypothetical protein